MATFLKTTSAKNLVLLDPVAGLVSYVLDIKPYHTKIVDVLIEYIHTDAVNATITENFDMDMVFTRPESTVEYSCGFGTLYDSTAGYQIVNVGSNKSNSSTTGLANNATVYSASVKVDGDISSIPFNITGSAAQTYSALLGLINTALTTNAVATLVGGNIQITSATTGETSTVVIIDTNLFSSLTGFIGFEPSTIGTPGYDNSSCSLAKAPDLYTSVTFTEKLVFELGEPGQLDLVLNFADTIGITFLENQPLGYTETPFGNIYDDVLGFNFAVTTTGEPVIGAWDTPRWDVGGFDEDLSSISLISK